MTASPSSPAAVVRAADATAIQAAAALLRGGALVAFPTETVYGLGADAGNDRAVAALFAAKGRPQFNPLIVHVPALADAERLVEVDERARTLAARFWPGPLTLVLPRRADAPLSLLVSAGLPTVAIRAPAHPVAQALIAAAGVPVAAPSANPSGRLSPSQAAHVAAGLDTRVAMVLDAGPCPIGIESTVIELTSERPALLRPGGLAAETIEAVIGPLASVADVADDDARPRSPGMLARHYAPGRPVRLNATAAASGEAFLGFGDCAPTGALNLSPRGDLEEAAANLFAMLWALDRSGVAAIAVAPIPDVGLGRAINDRLRRAATPADVTPDRDDWNDDRGPSAPCVLPDEEDPDAIALPGNDGDPTYRA